MPVNSTTQLGYLVDKILMYEKYTMPDPSYLNETLLVAGWYEYWTPKIGKPTVNYAINNYFKSSNGITTHSFITTGENQRTCYNYINNVGFVNYTAHGDITMWADPSFTNSNVNSLTNTNKPFWAMGNCCLTANFKCSGSSSTSFGETMIRANNKGAFGYIGSVPESYWYEDLYFGVDAYNAGLTGSTPSTTSTSKGAYDALFDETGFNCLNSVPYIGNIAVSYAYSKNYSNSGSSGCSAEYYWRAYQTFGDGSVMPYLKVPAANNVSHNNTIPAGASNFRVYADARSYVAITVNNSIIGVAAVPANATYVDVPFTTTPAAGQTAMIVVTRNQRQPYITTLSVVAAPTVTTTAISNIDKTTATGGGNVTADGGANVTARGICWSTSQDPTIAGSHTTDGTGTGSFTSSMTGLTANTTYYVRAYATNSASTVYGEQVSFTTLPAGVPGDVDGNESITMLDAVFLLRHCTGGSQLSGQALLNADLDGNGAVTMYDAILLLRMVVNQ